MRLGKCTETVSLWRTYTRPYRKDRRLRPKQIELTKTVNTKYVLLLTGLNVSMEYNTIPYPDICSLKRVAFYRFNFCYELK